MICRNHLVLEPKMSFWDYFQAYEVYMLLYSIYQHKYQYLRRHCS